MYLIYDDIEVPEGSFIMADGKHYMVRARHSGAMLTLEQLKGARVLAEKYGRRRVRIAARQNFQFYNLLLDDVEPMKKELAALDMPAVGRFSDICVNANSGLAVGEAFDVRPYADALKHWIQTSEAAKRLPGKFKMSLSSSQLDGGNASYGDLSFFAYLDEHGNPMFKLYAGGSLGAMPRLAIEIDRIPAEDFLFGAEAVAETFYSLFEGVDIGKKRMRFKIREGGEENFIALYRQKRDEVASRPWRINRLTSPEVLRPWAEGTLVDHPAIVPTKLDGIVSLMLHTFNGMLSLEQLDAILAAIDSLPHPVEIALDSVHGLWLRDLSVPEAVRLLETLEPVLGDQHRTHLVSCAGKGVCRFGLAHTGTLLYSLRAIDAASLPPIHISGCMNSCGRHQIAALGFWGKLTGAGTHEDQFDVVVGGRMQGSDSARMAEPAGTIRTRHAAELVRRLIADKASLAPEADWSDFLLAHKEQVTAHIEALEADEA